MLERVGHLFVQLVAQFAFGHRPKLDRIITRVAGLELPGALFHARNEIIGNFRRENKTFCGDARLAAVEVARRDRLLHCELNIGVVQHDKGVRTAQFEHTFF